MDPEPQFIRNAGGLPSAEQVGQPEIWTTVSFSQAWLRDTYFEAIQEGPDHRRKEVIFAICFAESYLFEFVRDVVLALDFRSTPRYFPLATRRNRGIKDRCKDVLKQLYQDGKVKGTPNWSEAFWFDFCRLVDIRDGLVHASISRPDTEDLPKGARPSPLPADFYALQPGWALSKAVSLVKVIHETMEIPPNPWILSPELLLGR